MARNTAKEVIITKDREGYHPKKDIEQDITLYVQLIPLDFDTVLFAKSIGNPAGYGDDLGDGTLINYDKYERKAGIMKGYGDLGREPTQETIKNLKKAINMINQAAQGTMRLTYIGKVNDKLSDGVTHIVGDAPPTHYEKISGYVIIRSDLVTRPDAALYVILEELMNTSTGLRMDGGEKGSVYIKHNIFETGFINDGERAIQLANLLPQASS